MTTSRALLPVAVGLLALAGCPGRDAPPSGFGVNLTISRAGLPANDQARITTLDLTTFGAESFNTKLPVSFFKDVEGRVRYVPKATTGTLTFVVQALDGSGGIVASARDSVNLASPNAVDLKLMLGAILKPDGASCGSSNECLSQAGCIDGVCCKTACPECRACAAGTGECTTLVASAADPDSCMGANTCDASGSCKKANGQTCAAAGECASNVCADGVCCNATCDGICRSCNLPASVGTCSAVVSAEDDTCRTTPATGVNVCDATGVCVQPRLVADVSPGAGSGLGFFGYEFRALANGLTFFRGTNAAGDEPWISDGTMGGTMLLKDIKTGAPSNSSPSSFTPLAGTMYFFATDNDGVRKLWKSDGTTAGTVVVKEPSAGGPIIGFGSNSNMVVFNNQLFFAAAANTGPAFGNGTELWKSDGTAAGTLQVQDFFIGNASTSPRNLTVVGNRLVFAGLSSFVFNPVANFAVPANEELLATDGTTIQFLKDINPDNTFPVLGNSGIAELTVAGGKAYFSAFGGNNLGTELWVTDGTPGGTMLVKDIVPGPGSSSPTMLSAAKGQLYFSAFENATGYELYRSDGTTGGTALVADILPGFNSSSPGPVEGVGGMTGEIFFSATEIISTVSKRSLYRSNGTSGAAVVPTSSAASPSPSSLTGFGNRLWFGAFNDANQYELWILDPASTSAFTACKGASGCFIPNVGNQPSVLQVRQPGRLWFPADQRPSSGVGFEPFVFP